MTWILDTIEEARGKAEASEDRAIELRRVIRLLSRHGLDHDRLDAELMQRIAQADLDERFWTDIADALTTVEPDYEDGEEHKI